MRPFLPSFCPTPNHPSMNCGLAAEAREVDDEEGGDVVPVRGLGRRFSALGGPLEGWRVASKRLGPLPRIRRGVQGRGCGREGSGALPLPRAAAVSTGLRVRPPAERALPVAGLPEAEAARGLVGVARAEGRHRHGRAWSGSGSGLGLGLGFGFGLGLGLGFRLRRGASPRGHPACRGRPARPRPRARAGRCRCR